MVCSACQDKPIDKPCDTCGKLPPVLQINSEECPVLFHTVELDGNSEDNPPYIGQHKNTLLVLKGDDSKWLFNSDGIPSKLTKDLGDIDFDKLINRPKYDGKVMTSETDIPNPTTVATALVAAEATARKAADNALSSRINSTDTSLAAEISARTSADRNLSNRLNDESTARQSADATLGSRIDTTDSNLATERNARIAADDALSSSVDSLSSSLSSETAARTAADTTLQNNIDAEVTARVNADTALQNSVDTIDAAIDTDVMTDLVLDPNTSTTVVQLDTTKKNLKTSVTVTGNVPLPVANATQAGVMNSATYNAIVKNTQDIANIIGEVVAITGLSASPTQADLTTAWLNASGESELINGASIYDVTNSKTWTYYSNTNTWYPLDASGSVSVNTFTNAAAGIIKGSTNIGQVYAESDGTGSVMGWDALKAQADNATSKLATVESGAQVNVQSDWAEADNTADDYIKNKPSNLVQDANYVHTDNNFTTALKGKLDGIEAGAEVNLPVDSALSSSSTNAVENQAIDAEFDKVVYVGTTGGTPTYNVLDIFYPVGSYYKTSDTTFDPVVNWGGTWASTTVGSDIEWHRTA